MTIIAIIIMAFIILLTGYTIFKKLNYRMSEEWSTACVCWRYC